VARTYEFNRIVGIDTFFVTLPGRSPIPIMNVVDHWTNFQLARVIEEPFTSESMWKCFANSWISPFGAPEVILCDGGPEFQSYFERSAELCGVFLHVINSESPWQNGKAARHGGLVKDLLAKAGEEDVVQDARDLGILLAQIVSQKMLEFPEAAIPLSSLCLERELEFRRPCVKRMSPMTWACKSVSSQARTRTRRPLHSARLVFSVRRPGNFQFTATLTSALSELSRPPSTGPETSSGANGCMCGEGPRSGLIVSREPLFAIDGAVREL
jgi:hypothetical protein